MVYYRNTEMKHRVVGLFLQFQSKSGKQLKIARTERENKSMFTDSVSEN